MISKACNKAFMLFIAVMIPFQIFGQSFSKLPIVNNRVIVNFYDNTVYMEILTKKTKKKASDDKFYYWYSANDIKRTRGAYEGKLLHGKYSDFYINKNLKEKGRMKYGLRVGTWKSWHPNGEYKNITYWRRGKAVGVFRDYNEDGEVIRKGRYRNGEISGKVKVYEADGSIEKIKYRNGKPVPKKEKKAKKVKSKKGEIENSESNIDSLGTEKKSSKRFFKKKKKDKNIEQPTNEITVPENGYDPNYNINSNPNPNNSMEQGLQGEGGLDKKEEKRRRNLEKKEKKKKGKVTIRKYFKIIPLKQDKLKQANKRAEGSSI